MKKAENAAPQQDGKAGAGTEEGGSGGDHDSKVECHINKEGVYKTRKI